MSTDITNTISTIGSSNSQLRQLSSEKTAESKANTDNIIRINFNQRQVVAESSKNISTSLTEDSQQDSSPEQTAKAIQESVSELNNSTQLVSRNLEFRIDNDSGRTVITVRDSSSNKVIRQIPSESLLEISARLKELESKSKNGGQTTGILFTSQT